MEKLVFAFFLATISGYFGTPLRAEVSPQKTETPVCANFHAQDILSRMQALEKINVSLNTLLTGKGEAVLAITTLFQIDLTLAEEIKRRAEELSALSQEADILKLEAESDGLIREILSLS